jgi:hypothetical protein
MGQQRNVLIELSAATAPAAALLNMSPGETLPLKAANIPSLPGLHIDPTYEAVPVPRQVPTSETGDPFAVGALFENDLRPEAGTLLVRGTIDEDAIPEIERVIQSNPMVLNVYSDPKIEVCIICPGSPALGNDTDVENRLGVSLLRHKKMDGHGVMLAIVDTGINLDYLRGRGKNPGFDGAKSWVPGPGLTPGDLPVGHGTMCAFDALIAAPKATLLDIAVLLSNRSGGSIMDGLLSDAVRAYAHLIGVMNAPKRPGESRSLVVNNSWGMFHPTWDFPVGHPGNYSDNPNHPFNRIVGSLERAGADILFAAGNCGRDCPDGRCQGLTNAGIFGANSHPQVLSVAGVDVSKTRVGYSTSGPGRLTRFKPDICGYTHFLGSGVYAADGGTSAATPVVAGVVAALRSKFPYQASNPRRSPAAVRNLVTRTAEDRGAVGFDFDHGWGIINGRRIALLSHLVVLDAVMEAEPEEVTGIREVPAPERAAAAAASASAGSTSDEASGPPSTSRSRTAGAD